MPDSTITRLSKLYERHPELVPQGWRYLSSASACHLRRVGSCGPATMLWLNDPTAVTLALATIDHWLQTKGWSRTTDHFPDGYRCTYWRDYKGKELETRPGPYEQATLDAAEMELNKEAIDVDPKKPVCCYNWVGDGNGTWEASSAILHDEGSPLPLRIHFDPQSGMFDVSFEGIGIGTVASLAEAKDLAAAWDRANDDPEGAEGADR